MNETIRYMLPMWLENVAFNEGRLKDVAKLKPKSNIERIIIEGTGPSRNKNPLLKHAPDTFLIQNQSSITAEADLVVVTDAQLVVAKLLQSAYSVGYIPKALAMANITSPLCTQGLPEEIVFGFKHPLAETVKHPFLHAINTMINAGSLSTFIIQVGCATNAAVLLAIELMKRGVLPKVPVFLMGVDYAFEKLPEDLSSCVFSNSGKITTPQFLRYAQDLNSIVAAHSEEFAIEAAECKYGLVQEFLPTVRAEDILWPR